MTGFRQKKQETRVLEFWTLELEDFEMKDTRGIYLFKPVAWTFEVFLFEKKYFIINTSDALFNT
ncbi:hypothetical protein [Arcicella rosea]|uniref:Uncharacterized protein n=1 Tax=Arcicella rosea TaxID=502909 RepID=A0A841EUZ3_9BACT|nr:hypothetical protein [Arcicella rosea]MBB6005209.1 hypothetical protein [Arcicella rosea]